MDFLTSRFGRDDGAIERLAWFAAGLCAAAVCLFGYQVAMAPPGPSRPPLPPRPTPGPIRVHVAGAVATPGVYELPPAARVEDALALAGGALAEADLNGLNLLGRLGDGERVLVPRRGEGRPPPARPSPTTPTRVGLNSASQAELEALPGVGPWTATRIIQRREQSRFASLDELVETRIVSTATLALIRDRVTLD
jgi:competence protein ComEA